MALSPSSAAFKPALYYQIFIPCDIISLALQSAGGGLSSQTGGKSDLGVNIGLAGLGFQVAVLLLFIILAGQYSHRYRRNLAGIGHQRNLGDMAISEMQTPHDWRRWVTSFLFLAIATLLIFVRCIYRIYELSDGYRGAAIHDETLFIALESW
jgi:hypothetical protein